MALPMHQLGWMAGIVDLKGRILRKNNKTRKTMQLVLSVDTKEIAIVRKLSAMTGTRPELQAAQLRPDFMRRNCSEHCPEQHVHVGTEEFYMPQIARWTITGAGMVVVLSSLLPFLSIDRGWDQAVEDATNQTVFHGPGSGMVKSALFRLKELGWDLPVLYEAHLQEEEESDEQD